MQNLNYEPNDVVGIECKNVSYGVSEDRQDDFVIIKEVVHIKDGRKISRIVMRENIRRPVYVTKPEYRNHNEKKEFEEKSKTIEYKTTDCQMNSTLQMALGNRFPNPKQSLKKTCSSPYVYFADLPVTSWIRKLYKDKYPNVVSKNRIAWYDIETNEADGTKEPIIVSFICDDEIHVAITKKYADKITSNTDDIHEMIVKDAKERLSKVAFTKDANGKKLKDVDFEIRDVISNYKFFTYIMPTPGCCIKQIFSEIHRLLPDLIAAWNMEFDISNMIKALNKENIALEDVFCHPAVPKKYRNVDWVIDKASKKTESKSLTKSPDQQWHKLYCQASFYAIDSMCVYSKLRVHEGKKPSMKLNDIMQSVIGAPKLDIPGLPYVGNLEWHITAQKKFPLNYITYNIYDNLGMVLQDRVIQDLESAVSVLIGYSDLHIFPSLPKRICTEFTYYLYEQGYVIGSVGGNIKNDMDEEVIGTDGWIVTLPAHMTDENGLKIISEMPDLSTNVMLQVSDFDLTQAYPNGNIMSNQSRETTLVELISIDGVSEDVRRRAGINLTAGRVNAMEIANELFLLPSKTKMFEVIKNKLIASGKLPANDIETDDKAA